MLLRFVRSLIAEIVPSRPRQFRRRLLSERSPRVPPEDPAPPTFGQRGTKAEKKPMR